MSGWDARFDREDYVYGTAPAGFLADWAHVLGPGSRVLSAADGEGRNSVHLAALGHDVTAFDASPVAVEKARKLAATRGVVVDFQVAGIEAWDWSQQVDAVVGIFIQFLGPPQRDRMLADMARAVRPGGLMLLHGYAPRQVEYGTGGPGRRENMYTITQLAAAFDGWEILRLADYDAEIEEGIGHAGRSALVDLIARKPA
ncbi:class I SAM-dependent methyltransferase [Roseibacterium beibuensis]|uniref:Class I SAM-dependent methyltransferase n=1 Tax=[Roseibacterium] beibuensis TaxID=1193142 RepID=A0ABP9LLM7_9RHOB|nr:class I SAM-dependent methyltransferase [Roseibacterium beibuensis]MCS6625941.1 class I SAM-dependent methyltransferase [Roseibacterium beibuensis]